MNSPTSSKPVNEATLMGLPFELRRQIYHELFVSTACRKVPCHWESHHPHLQLSDPLTFCICRIYARPQSLGGSILRVCHQVYEEALSVLYDDTKFYMTDLASMDGYGGSYLTISPERLNNLKHLRFEVTPDLSDCEEDIADTIRFILDHCPLLEDLELQLRFVDGNIPYFSEYIESHGQLAAIISQANLRKGFFLTFKDDDFVRADVARDFRLAIAPEERWYHNGWDFTYDGYAMEWGIKWARAWSLRKLGTNLRFLKEPSEGDIDKINENVSATIKAVSWVG